MLAIYFYPKKLKWVEIYTIHGELTQSRDNFGCSFQQNSYNSVPRILSNWPISYECSLRRDDCSWPIFSKFLNSVFLSNVQRKNVGSPITSELLSHNKTMLHLTSKLFVVVIRNMSVFLVLLSVDSHSPEIRSVGQTSDPCSHVKS